jgi:hypothetical protein
MVKVYREEGRALKKSKVDVCVAPISRPLDSFTKEERTLPFTEIVRKGITSSLPTGFWPKILTEYLVK